MKKVVILCVILLCFPLVLAGEDYDRVDEMTVSVDIYTTINIESGTVQEIQAELGFFPQGFSYQVLDEQTFSAIPEAEIVQGDNEVRYTWSENSDSYYYENKNIITTTNRMVAVRDKVAFPAAVDEDIAIYTVETELLDITSEMQALAEEIVKGEDDLYQAAFKLANWTEGNIQYNLSSLTADAVQPSSWVLDNRYGVCDELTNLFISMARSVGIPARFVSGLVYSNLNNDFGAHGWAEVYIDGQWVPFDVTFGTYGWVDPSHIKFREELGSNKASVAYEWTGYDIELDAESLVVESEVLRSSGDGLQLVDLSISALVDSVGRGSVIPIQVMVTNNEDYYVPVKLVLTKAPEVQGNNVKSVLLEPNEEKAVFWLVEVPGDADEGYVYTTTVEVQSVFGETVESQFSYGYGYDFVSQEDAEEMIALLLNDEDLSYLDNVDLSCDTDTAAYYSTESATITCIMSGDLEDVEVCFLESCQDAAESITWSLNLTGYTSQRMVVSASNGEEATYAYFDLNVVDVANVIITDITPTIIPFGEATRLHVSFYANSPVENFSMELENYGSYGADSLEGEQRVTLSVVGAQFLDEELVFHLSYTDALGESYTSDLIYLITITDVPWYYKIIQFFFKLF